MTRDQLLHLANQMPEKFELDTLLEKLVFVEGINEAIESSEGERGISHEQMVAEFQTLFNSKQANSNI